MNFIINQPPTNGSCSIDPLNGTITTLFTVTCLNWFDTDGIKDYTLYSIFILCKRFQKLFFFIILAWTTDPTQRTMLLCSPVSNFQVRLPSGNNETSLLNLVIVIRDLLDCTAQFNISSISVIVNLADITDFINVVQDSSTQTNNNQFVQLLSSKNQNAIGQVVTSLSQQFNSMNTESVNDAVSSK